MYHLNSSTNQEISLKSIFKESSTFTQEMIEKTLMRNDSNYVLYQDVLLLMRKLSEEFREILIIKEIGKTHENRPIQMIEITLKNSSQNSMLITGAHHSRELSSIQLPLLTALQLCHGYYHKDQETINFLQNHKMLLIPIINVDGFNYISEKFTQFGKYPLKRKNMNSDYENGTECDTSQKYFKYYLTGGLVTEFDDVMSGVDLNRNYDWDFGNGGGSSNDPCNEQYRGPYPFSESETRAIRDLVEQRQNDLKVIYNIHTYGNLLVHPFSHQKNNILAEKFPHHAKIYEEIWDEGPFPKGNERGNAQQVVGYEADGEACDWIFSKYQIICASPELGLQTYLANDFILSNREVVKQIIGQNFKWIKYTMRKIGPQLKLSIVKATKALLSDEINIVLRIDNTGLGDFKLTHEQKFDRRYHIQFETNYLTHIQILNGEATSRYLGADQSQIMTFTPHQDIPSRGFTTVTIQGRLNENYYTKLSKSQKSAELDDQYVTIEYKKYPLLQIEPQTLEIPLNKILKYNTISLSVSEIFNELLPQNSYRAWLSINLVLITICIIAIVGFCLFKMKKTLWEKYLINNQVRLNSQRFLDLKQNLIIQEPYLNDAMSRTDFILV
ncbi:zinc carboxypeptidase family [Stylonychia lemnae]|uniref:Zinc carboxypeptidase family n=1 Tax=Stylonychia lemnae TaxID=5949 RepID=A0A077ZRP4_STYLE|nr:zinc carboxypeptidase family [Stylonychia lemnae]|eukprot:CDW72010.1 zinc carboxypeptidase family [Stylonychia lemnae]